MRISGALGRSDVSMWRWRVRPREASGVRPTLAALWVSVTRAALKPPQSRRCALLSAFFLLVAIACLPTLVQGSETNEVLKLAPPYGELPPTFWEQQGGRAILTAVIVLIVFILTLWLVLRPRPVPPVPLEVRTRRALEALQGRSEDGVLLSEISQILRRYVATAFGLPNDECTTAEFSRRISTNEALGAELAVAIVKFLETCDVRKFAPTTPVAPMNAVAQARELFERAEVRRQQAAASASKTPA